jgi:hypothetical protein
MDERIKTPSEVATLVIDALDTYKARHPLFGEEVEEIQNAGSVPRIRLEFKTGETFVIDITREPRPKQR